MTSVSTSLPVTYPQLSASSQSLFFLSSPLNIFEDYGPSQVHRLGGPQDSRCLEAAGIYFLFYPCSSNFSPLFRHLIVTSLCAKSPLYQLNKLFLRHKCTVVITTVTTRHRQSKPITWLAGGVYL
jgi:hypothetical protein